MTNLNAFQKELGSLVRWLVRRQGIENSSWGRTYTESRVFGTAIKYYQPKYKKQDFERLKEFFIAESISFNGKLVKVKIVPCDPKNLNRPVRSESTPNFIIQLHHEA